MSDYGITVNGFVMKSYEQCLNDTLLEIEALFGRINRDSNSKFYQLAQIFASKESERWEALKYFWDMLNVSGAEGVFLDEIVANFDIKRLEAKQASVMLSMVCDIGTVIPAGTLIQCSANGAQFATVAQVTATDTYTQVYARSVLYGAVFAPSNTLTIIITPVVGLNAVYNMQAASVGRDRETDAALRYRFLSYARKYLGASTLPSMQQKLEQNLITEGIASSVKVFANDTGSIDAEGRPAHSVEIVTDCAASQDIYNQIAQAIFSCKGASVPTYLDTNFGVTGNAQDSDGVLHTINFSRIAYLNAYIRITLTKSTEEFFPAEGETIIKSSCVLYGNENMSQPGDDFIAGVFSGKAFEVPGIRAAVAEVSINNTTWNSVYIPISARQRLVFSESNVTILWS